ncbi:hypothetical protein AMELA_G00269700, partial [Ameiurus melas]
RAPPQRAHSGSQSSLLYLKVFQLQIRQPNFSNLSLSLSLSLIPFPKVQVWTKTTTKPPTLTHRYTPPHFRQHREDLPGMLTEIGSRFPRDPEEGVSGRRSVSSCEGNHVSCFMFGVSTLYPVTSTLILDLAQVYACLPII